MKPKRILVSRQLSVYTYTDHGALLEDHPFVQNNITATIMAIWMGTQLLLPPVFAAFQGTLQINDTIFEIKPKSPYFTLEHLVYKITIEDTQLLSMRCGLINEKIARQLELYRDSNLKQNSYEGWWAHKRIQVCCGDR